MNTIAPFGMTICGVEELSDHRETGASHVLSILDPDWPVPEVFGSFGEHKRLELRFHDVIDETVGTAPPQVEDVAGLLNFGRDLSSELPEGSHLLVHCHAGISRSTAAMALILAQALPDLAAQQVLQEVLRIRPKAWPNLRIIELGDGLLSRNGEMIAAAIEVYSLQLETRPELENSMITGGRSREVAAARSLNLTRTHAFWRDVPGIV